MTTLQPTVRGGLLRVSQLCGGNEVDLDVVIPSAGPLRSLETTLPSVAAAADRVSFDRRRITVVDDRPERPIAGLVDGLGLRRLTGGRLGRSRARNLGAAVGEASWLVFIDDDVELDLHAFAALLGDLREEPFGVMGGLRPPPGSPVWLRWTYEDEVLTAATGLAAATDLPCRSLSSALCALRRREFEAVGGFPHVEGWGGEDVLLGMSLQQLAPDASLRRDPAFGGVHHFVPSFDEWLERRFAAGLQLAELEDSLPGPVGRELLQAFQHRGTARSVLKRVASWVPPAALRRARGRTARRVAAAAMETRGYRLARSDRGS